MTNIKSEIVTITPAMATRWLENSEFRNRNVSDANVEKLARDIKNGRWVFDGNPIRFNENGDVLDGQHRLWAIVTAGRSVQSIVVNGLMDSAFLTIDSGKVRNNSDIMSFSGFTNCNVLASVCRLIRGARDSGGDMLKWSTGIAKRRLSVQELIEEAKSDEEIKDAISFVSKLKFLKRNGGFSTPSFCYYYIKKLTKDRHMVDMFFLKLHSGADLHNESPILALRNFLIAGSEDMRTRDGNLLMAKKIALFFKAWNLYRLDKPCKKLFFNLNGNEAFPQVK